jgi:molecular chaperone DnaK (HSP70)
MRLHLPRRASTLLGDVPKELKVPRAVKNAIEQSSSPEDVPAVSLGIDLGTTNSVAAVVTAEYGPSLVPCSDTGDSWTLPSVVTFKKNGDVVVGEEAKRQAAVFPDNTFYSVKRLIGKEFAEVKKACF